MRKVLFLSFSVVLIGLTAQARDRQNFDIGWRFILADSVQMSSQTYNDGHWRILNLPHDWAIEGDFFVGNPSGAGGGALPGGIGWYRKHFSLDCEAVPGNRYFIEFDGVYMNSTVYVNGQEVGHRPYGYSSFEYDITKFLKQGDNVIAVKVDNSDQPNSRWYSGCGIYRHVWLTKTHSVHVKHWGVHVVTDAKTGQVKVDVELDKYQATNTHRPTIKNTVFDANGKEVGLKVKNPHLWSVEDPYIYKVRTQVMIDGRVVDEVWTTTGFRDFKFDAETGFWLNGKNFKLNGVCEHHDFGCLGAAVNEDAMHRKLSKLKAMGVNSIRSSHNPPAPELLNMCDTMGIIVMDESFDMWRRKKTAGDYARFFDEWHERDLTDLILRDRNHPSVLMWSIGNEVLEQWSSAEADTLTLEQANLILNAGHDASTLAKDGELSVQSLLTRHLAEIVKRYDTTRPVLAGCNEPDPNNHLFKSGAIDIIGFNYHHQWVKDVPKKFPGKPFIFSESVSALQTRGYYKMPSDEITWAPQEWWLPYTDPSYMCSSYDNMHASWSSTHEETWDVVKHNAFVGGQYIWTGFDYIGEPTPYGFPARSSYFGIIDLAGFPKDTYYMYQSEWTTKPVLHLFPHWNWVPGDEIDMWCYYNNADEVELFINGKSQGVRRKTGEQTEGRYDMHNTKARLNSEYHVGWRVVFDPGEVKVVARKDGKVVGEQTIKTAGAPARIRLSKDYQGKNTTFVTAEVVDKDGNLCPWAEDQIYFIYEGNGQVLGTDNGCQTSMENFKAPQRKAFFGKCMVVVSGNGSITAKSPTLQSDVIQLKVNR
ncbi:glycoside hydrolase family 2 TIM barrel-domain containing protein [Prevotella sp. tf2-5]|uniref:glycoside hydrolase family 2 TIM barrel-domain containing protein n=1 Tax=Prevotella sp. tf2-5 TaxID=1761889 RepID=UPI0008EC1B46|nr:glycoside hydrolase family 2 TIM barrel-domain containing protein [Prevotella sp. tf2-5]SFO80865.1 beta-galactosidase [Prevotella sp. tf2-5]